MRLPSILRAILCGCLLAIPAKAAELVSTATAINQFGLDLHRRLAAGGGNQVISPWSIESALAMTYAGADGKTKAEMAKVLHFPADEAAVHAGFRALAADLKQAASRSAKETGQGGGPATPLELTMANRLFGQQGFAFEKPFLKRVSTDYGAPLEPRDFVHDAAGSTRFINDWVAQTTHRKIQDLIPSGALTADTRLVLVNAIYLKASWLNKFNKAPAAPFFVNGTNSKSVTTMTLRRELGYTKIDGASAVTVPYVGGALQFVLLIPDQNTGLAALERSLTAAMLAKMARAKTKDIILSMPKFKLEPPTISLADQLSHMGMPTAFDKPVHSADFSRIAARTPDDYLYIGKVFHKAFIAVDHEGTEAAAATAVAMPKAAGMPAPKPPPLVVKADRPFVFAIQHVASGACLFLGRVTDPR